jgi:hypothetical protein
MEMRHSCFFYAVCALAVSGSFALSVVNAAEPCLSPKYIAPLPVHMKAPKPWGKDSGPIVDGYIGLKDHPEVLYGIDLSKHNAIKDYGVYSRCGGKFAFLRLDPAFRNHRQRLAGYSFTVIPYVYFPISATLRLGYLYSDFKSVQKERVAEKYALFEKIGKDAALHLPDVLQQQGLTEIPKISFAGLEGRILAVDVEEKLEDEKTSSKNALRYYGLFYARAICSWIDTVRARFPDVQIIIYSTPTVFGDYLHDLGQQDDDCLRGLPLWMARTTVLGEDLTGKAGSLDHIDKYSQKACFQTSGNRCIIHQYSHRGVIGQILPVSDSAVLHVDLNRAFPVKPVKDAKTTQYVRR